MAMPAASVFKDAIVAQLLAMKDEKGEPMFAKRDADGKIVPGKLPDPLDKMMEGVAAGMQSTLDVWRSTQMVTVVGVTPPGTGAATGPFLNP